MTKNQKVIRKDQQIVFIFVWKLFKRTELREKINVIENPGYYKKNNVSVKFAENLHVSKLYIIFGAVLPLLKDPLFPDIGLS